MIPKDDNWRLLWGAYFKGRMSDDDFRLWENELRYTCDRVPDDAELCAVIREMSRDDKTPAYPTLKNLRIAIFRHRRAARDADKPPAEECSCSDGWMGYIRRKAGMSQFSVSAVPCLCSAGQHWLQSNYDPAQHQDLRAKAEQGMADLREATEKGMGIDGLAVSLSGAT